MIFEYDELREYVKEDFERFYKMGFNETQILPAVLNEYKHAEDFCQLENICIHVFLTLQYAEKNMDFSKIVEHLKQLVTEEVQKEVRVELGKDYTKFSEDLYIIGNYK